MALAVDQEPVGALASYAAHPAFREGVCPGGADRRPDHPRAKRCEHPVERHGELGVAVPDEELEVPGSLTQIHEQIPGLLGDPWPGRIGGGAHDVHGPAGVFDEEQDVDPLEEHGVYVEEITCPDPHGTGFQELAPGRAVAPGCGIQADPFEDVAYRTGRYPDPGPCELAADPLVSPGGVLARQAQHRSADVCPGGGAAWTFQIGRASCR